MNKALSLRTSTIPECIIATEGFMNVIAVDHSEKTGHAPAVPISDSSLLSHHWMWPLKPPWTALRIYLSVASPMPVEGCGSCRKGTQYRGSNVRLGSTRIGWIDSALARSARWKPMCPSWVPKEAGGVDGGPVSHSAEPVVLCSGDREHRPRTHDQVNPRTLFGYDYAPLGRGQGQW